MVVVVLNEVLADPDGPDEGQEWVELWAREDVALDGWTLESGTAEAHTLATLAGQISGGGFFVVSGLDGLGNALGSADLVRLVDAGGHVVDTLVYGGPNSDGFLGDDGLVATSLAPAPERAMAIARRADGRDTDRGDDWALAAPTPGAANPVPPPCSLGEVRINEVLPDPEGEDAGAEWVELVASGDPVPLDGWSLALATRAESVSVVPLEGVVAEFFLPPLSGSIGNGTGADAVWLVDCEGRVVDTVLYGESAEDLVDDAGAGEPYGDPGSDQSLARRIDGEDTDAAVDWVVSSRPTPGASNEVVMSEAPGDGLPVGGCAGPPEPGAPSGGCAGAAPFAWLLTWRLRRGAEGAPRRSTTGGPSAGASSGCSPG